MKLASDLRVLYHLVLKPVRGKDHAARMESFYAGQAEAYDGFRDRLLQGRRELFRSIDVPEDGVWVDLGGGTGSNQELLGPRIADARKVYIVDLSPSLLAGCPAAHCPARLEQRGDGRGRCHDVSAGGGARPTSSRSPMR